MAVQSVLNILRHLDNVIDSDVQQRVLNAIVQLSTDSGSKVLLLQVSFVYCWQFCIQSAHLSFMS